MCIDLSQQDLDDIDEALTDEELQNKFRRKLLALKMGNLNEIGKTCSITATWPSGVKAETKFVVAPTGKQSITLERPNVEKGREFDFAQGSNRDRQEAEAYTAISRAFQHHTVSGNVNHTGNVNVDVNHRGNVDVNHRIYGY